ncbi:MAG: flagellar hook-associated protein FlgK [Syntrophorhabdales bacterium]
MSIGTILNIARTGLEASQVAIQTTSHNISNVDTPGYSEQQAVLQEAMPTPTSIGLMGDGVSVVQIKRYADENLQKAISSKNADVQQQQVYEQNLTQIQSIFNEDNSQISTNMTTFFNDWSTLSTDPTSTADKETVAADGKTLCTTFNSMYNDLVNLQASLNGSVNDQIDDVNTATSKIASLNQLIVAGAQGTSEANDYLDERDQLLQQLSGYMNISYFTDSSGMVNVLTQNGTTLVQGVTAYQLTKQPDPTTGLTDVGWDGPAGSTEDITNQITGGSLGAYLTNRDTTIPGYLSNLNGLAQSIMQNVNYFHEQGNADVGANIPFFQSSTANYAQGISLATQIENGSGAVQTQNIMASSSTANAANNDVASAIAGLGTDTILGGSMITSQAFTSSSTALNLSGNLVINGVAVAIGPTDTLAQIANSVNTAFTAINASTPQIGVTASIAPTTVNGSAEYQLVLSATGGTSCNVSVVNGNLGAPSSGTGLLNSLTTTSMSDPATTAAGVEGSFSLDGHSVQVTSGQTLEQIAAAINGTAGMTSYAVVAPNSSNGYNLALLTNDTPAPAGNQPNLSWEQASLTTPITANDPNTLALPGGVNITFQAGQSLQDVANTINNDEGTTGYFATITQDAGNYKIVLYPTSNVMSFSSTMTQGLGLSGSTYAGYEASVVGNVGQATESATNLQEYNQSALTSLQQQQSQESGVSIDDEMSNLIQFQNAYQAAARLFTVAQSMLDSLISAVGGTTS